MSKYLPTIGIECHVQLKTKTKLFAAVGNDAREAPPNTLVSHICLGMPGALPVLNKHAVELAAKAAFALKTTPQKFSKFDRKHYFYPDLPKGYQISQFSHPVVLGGEVDIVIDGEKKKIGITRAHLEEDAGKNTHPSAKEYSLVDLNRAGTPLLEIVSEPDMHSAVEARAYVNELYLLMKYAEVTEGDLYHGNMRFDVNISLSDDPNKLGNRSEIKNLNSFRAVEKAVEYEIKRQTSALEKGETLKQETRGWNDAKQKTFSQRTKEEAHDYRYFPDPDIPPVVLDDEFINKAKASMPAMPDEWRRMLSELNISSQSIDTLIQAEAELQDKVSFLGLIRENIDDTKLSVFLANWNVNIFIPLVREDKLKLGSDKCLFLEKNIYEMTKEDKISSTNAKALFEELIQLQELPDSVEEYAQTKGYIQVSDEGAIGKIVEDVLAENEQAAQDVKNGEMKVIGFLVGQVMKASQGKANPALAQKLIKQQILGQ